MSARKALPGRCRSGTDGVRLRPRRYTGYAAGFLILGSCLAHAEVTVRPVIALPLQGDISRGDVGASRTRFVRRGGATFYDVEKDRLMEAGANQPRFERFAGQPARQDQGLLVEAPAKNHLTNSSFELGLSGWRSELATVNESRMSLHGERAALLRGKPGFLLHDRIVPVPSGTPPKGSGFFGALSVYCSSEGKLEGLVRPVVFGLDGETRGRNLVKDYKFVRMGTGKWRRLVGRFQLLRPGTAYLAGFQLLKKGGLSLDAAQLEVNHFPWAASSYIPAGQSTASRAVEYLEVHTSDFPVRKGSVTLWLRITNPYYRCGYIFVHGPFKNHDRLFIHGGAVMVGERWSRWVQRPGNWPRPGSWHLLAVTWDGRKAVQYLDGEEFGQQEGPFAYRDFEKYGGRFLVGSNAGTGDLGAEGVVSGVTVWDAPLSAESVRELWKQGGAGPAPSPLQAERPRPRSTLPAAPLKPGGIPIRYEFPVKGKVSVGIYDSEGRLRRQLVLGRDDSAGMHEVFWDGRDDCGRLMSAGEYEFRAVSNHLSARWAETVGNTGEPPWGSSVVRGGLFKSIAKYGDGVVVSNPLAEGNHGVQRLDSRGQVVWTSEIDPVYCYLTALAADEKFVYVAGLIRNERAPRGQLYREVVWRIDGANGKVVPWGKRNVVDLNEPRVAPPGRKFFDRYYNREQRYRYPLPGFEVHDLEVSGGKLYVPFFRENCVRIVDVLSGRVTATLKSIPSPQGIAVAGSMLLAASGTKILRFSVQGIPGGVFTAGLEAPYEVEMDQQGRVYTTDLGESQQVKIFSPDGKLERTIGPPRGGLVKDGRLDRLFLPTGIAIDHKGRITVADFGNGRVRRFTPRGEADLTVEAPGFGGMDGGVSFIPGDPTRLFLGNMFVFGTRINHTIVAYRTGARGGKWATRYRWPDVSPVFCQEPLYARRLPNGRTYLFCLARNPSIFELRPSGELQFCTALLHPLDYRVGHTMRPEVEADARALGLLNERKLPHCRMTWVDKNRNCRMEKGEITLLEQDSRPFYTVNDACVKSDGTIYMKDYITSTYWRFVLQGFDEAGNPLYDWRSAKKIWDAADYDELKGLGRMLVANEVDEEGGMYFSYLKGPGPAMPTHVKLLKFDRQGRFRWSVGRRARGLKDKPGEFISVVCIAGVIRNLVFVLEYEGRVDLYTTDGLYLNTFLKGTIEDNSPYSNWGENFAGDVVEDSKTGDVYFVINTHNYRLPYFKVIGIGTVRRASGTFRLSASAREKLEKLASTRGNAYREKITAIYHRGDRAIRVDGDLKDWEGLPETEAVFPDARNKDHHAKCRAAYDIEFLYLAFSVADPTPAVNKCTSPSVLWDGDCLELYLSRNIDFHQQWKAGDYILHLAGAESSDRPAAGLLHRIQQKWAVPSAIERSVRIWPDRRGYNLEARVPLGILGLDSLQPGELVRFDWDLCYSGNDGKVAYKLAWSDSGNQVLINPDSWLTGRCVLSPGEERSIYAATKSLTFEQPSADWLALPVQAQIKLPEADDQYWATLRVAADAGFLYFCLEVADPDPALVTPGANWIGAGDFIEIELNRRIVYLAAGPAFHLPYILTGGKAEKIPNAKSDVQPHVNGHGYRVRVAIPWTAVGGPRESLPFNWRIGWSDASGGSAFARRSWLPWGKESGTLRVNP